jgi:excisionase family DNA binding protein
MSKNTISATDAAKRLGVNLNFVYDLMRVGKLRARKRGKQWRVPEQAIRERLARLSEAQAANSR